MQRREARLRKEYLYRKSLEEQESRASENKKRLKTSLEKNSVVYNDLKGDLPSLSKQLHYDEGMPEAKTSIDDEYQNVGLYDPKVLVTTSRDPSSRLQQFAKEMKLVLPNSQRINRGNHIINDIAKTCRSNNVTDLVILHEHRGIPDGMIISHFPYGPTAFFSLHNVVLRHDIKEEGGLKTMSEAFPHLIFNNFSTRLGDRITSVLKALFPIPKEDSKRVLSFINQNDFISMRHHTFSEVKSEVELTEVGPRFEMKPYDIKLGTIEIADADSEWCLRPYMNTSKKRQYI